MIVYSLTFSDAMLKEEPFSSGVVAFGAAPKLSKQNQNCSSAVVSTYSFLYRSNHATNFPLQLCNMAMNKSAVEIANEFTSFLTALSKTESKNLKRELISNVAYPLFCHTYISCLAKNEQIANDFWAKYNEKLKNQTGTICNVCEKLANYGFLKHSIPRNNDSATLDLEALANMKVHRTISESASEQLSSLLSTNAFPYVSTLFINKFHIVFSNVENDPVEIPATNENVEKVEENLEDSDVEKLFLQDPKISFVTKENGPENNEKTTICTCNCDSRNGLPSVIFHLIDTNLANVFCADLMGNYIALGASDNAIRTIDLLHSQIETVKQSLSESENIKQLTESLPEDKFLEGIFEEQELSRGNIKSLEILHGHHKPVYSVKFANTWPYLLSCSGDTDCRLWDVTTRKSIVRYSGHNFPLFDVDIANHDLYFASVGQDMTCRLWTFENSTSPLRTLCRHEATVNSVKFHPNGKFLLTGGNDCVCVMWDIDKGEHVRIFSEQQTQVSCVKFSPNGQFVSVGKLSNMLEFRCKR